MDHLEDVDFEEEDTLDDDLEEMLGE